MGRKVSARTVLPSFVIAIVEVMYLATCNGLVDLKELSCLDAADEGVQSRMRKRIYSVVSLAIRGRSLSEFLDMAVAGGL